MFPEEKQTNRWLVRGLVVGPKLPKNAIKLGRSCRIKRIPDSDVRAHLQRAAQIRVEPLERVRQEVGSVGAFSLTPPLTHYTESKHELSITVTATNPPLAAAKAVEEADVYLAALTLAVGQQKYLFGPTAVEKLRDAEGFYPDTYAPSGLGLAGVFYPEHLEHGDEQYAKSLLKLSEENKAFGKAFGYLHAAWWLSSLPLPDPSIHKAVLSNCFLVLETIANDVTKEWRKKNKEITEKEQRTTVDELTGKLKKLDHLSDVGKKVAAVREAYRELQRADRFFQDLKLKTAGEMLGVEKRFVELAVELSELRNKKLNHPGSMDAEDLNKWIYKAEDEDPGLSGYPAHFGKGESTGVAYLNAYAVRLQANDETNSH